VRLKNKNNVLFIMNVLVFGTSGFLGQAFKYQISRLLDSSFYSTRTGNEHVFNARIKKHSLELNFIYASRKDLYSETKMVQTRIHIIINFAAKCGGLYDNMSNNYDFYVENQEINKHIFRLAESLNVKLLINMLSTCIFPKDNVSYPLTSNQILNGPCHESNEGYSYSKRNCFIQGKMFSEKTGIKVLNFIPTNLYGIGDKSTHVFPELVKKCILAKKNNSSVFIKGSGNASRQFLYIDDLATIILEFLKPSVIENLKQNQSIIVSPPINHEITIEELVNLVCKEIDFTGNVIFDTSFSDGQLKKTCDTSEIDHFIDFSFTPLAYGISRTCFYFQNISL
jgi:GDP-L-fucose synthase